MKVYVLFENTYSERHFPIMSFKEYANSWYIEKFVRDDYVICEQELIEKE